MLASHLGRPKGKPDQKYSLEPVAARLAELLGADVALTDEPVGDGARKVVNDLRDGDGGAAREPALLARRGGERRRLRARARQLRRRLRQRRVRHRPPRARVDRRASRSFVADKGIGLLMEREVKFLGRLLGEVERPFVAIIGGAKVSDKIGVLENLLGRVDALLIGGAMANTFLKAKGGKLGRSLVEEDKLALARAFLRKAEERERRRAAAARRGGGGRHQGRIRARSCRR